MPIYSSERANRLRPLSEEDRIGVISVHEGKHVVDNTTQKDVSTREKMLKMLKNDMLMS